MNTIERLQILYKERHIEHHDMDRWDEAIEAAWPDLLAVVEATVKLRDLKLLHRSGDVDVSRFEEAFDEIDAAIAKLKGGVK